MSDKRVDSVECLKCAASVIVGVIALFALWLITTPARAQEPEGSVRIAECKRPACVMVPEVDLDALMASNNNNFKRAEKAEAALKAAQEGAPPPQVCGA